MQQKQPVEAYGNFVPIDVPVAPPYRAIREYDERRRNGTFQANPTNVCCQFYRILTISDWDYLGSKFGEGVPHWGESQEEKCARYAVLNSAFFKMRLLCNSLSAVENACDNLVNLEFFFRQTHPRQTRKAALMADVEKALECLQRCEETRPIWTAPFSQLLLDHWETVKAKIQYEDGDENEDGDEDGDENEIALAIRRLQGSRLNPVHYADIQRETENLNNLLHHPISSWEWDNLRMKYISERSDQLGLSFPNINTNGDARLLLNYRYYVEIIVSLVGSKDTFSRHTDEEIAAQWNLPPPPDQLCVHVSQPFTAEDVAGIRDTLSHPSLAWAYQELQLFLKDMFADLQKDTQEESWVNHGLKKSSAQETTTQPSTEAIELAASTLSPATLDQVSEEILALCLSARWQGQTCARFNATVRTHFNPQKPTLQRLEERHGIRYTQWLTFQKSPIVALHLDLKALLNPQVVRDVIGLANVVSIFLHAYEQRDLSYANLWIPMVEIENVMNRFVGIKSLQRLDFGKWLWTKENLDTFKAVRLKSCGTDCTIQWLSDDD